MLNPSQRTLVLAIGDLRPPSDAWSDVGEGVEVVQVEGDVDWWTSGPAAALAAHDRVVLVDASWAPGPRLVERLASAASDGIVDARVLPVETTRVHDPREQGEDMAPPETVPDLRVSAACCLVPAAHLVELAPLWRVPLAEGRGDRLTAWAAAAGVEVTVEPSAAVFLPVRVDARGVPLGPVRPADPTPSEPPADLHPAALPATSLASMLEILGPRPEGSPADPAAGRPFLSVVTRTQGLRLQCLEEVLTCLAGQTNRDFELLLMCHRVTDEARDGVRLVVADQPAWLRDRTRLIDVERPGRSAPLNDGFEAARGRYIAMLDDDDTVLAHWVETFAELERQGPGPLLRAVTLRQDALPLPDQGQLAPVSVGNPFAAWAMTFEMVDHLRVNHSPCMSVAFPRGVFHDLGVRFDEELPATEDWDFLLRAAGLVGAHSSPEVTSVYRWWLEQASSRDLHSGAEWDAARDRLLARIDETVVLLPPGSVARLREVTDEGWREAAAKREEAVSLASSLNDVIARLDETAAEHEHTVAILRQAEEMLLVGNRQLSEANGRAEAAAAAATRIRRRLKRRVARLKRRQQLMAQADDLLRVTGRQAEHGSPYRKSARQLRTLIATLEGRTNKDPSTRRS